MKLYVMILFVQIFAFGSLYAQTEKSFPQFTWMNAMPTRKDGSRFGYEKNSFTLINKLCNQFPLNDPRYMKYDDFVLLGEYKNSSMKEHVNILYSPGPSGDPLFRISDKKNRLIWESLGEEMAIGTNGIIYLSGTMDRMFNMRFKLQIFPDGAVKEIKQPYYYAGVKDKLLKPVKLYSKKIGGDVVATLSAGCEVEVLLAEADVPEDKLPMNYLVRTMFGLVGWMRLTEDDVHHMNPAIKGIGYMGD